MATRTIKPGDTLGTIASQYGTTPDALMALNPNNPSLKSKDLIIQGGSLNIHENAVTRPSPTSGPAPTTTGAAVPPNVMPDSGMSASFSTMQKDLDAATAGLSDLFPPPPAPGSAAEKASPEYISSQARRQNIQTTYQTGLSDIESARQQGEFSRQRAGELLGLAPAAIKNNIESYMINSNAFDKGVASAIERLTNEENTALANEDATYASQVRQQKLDFYNMQRQAMQDKLSFMSSAFNMMLSGKQEARQEKLDTQTEASNKLNIFMQSYSGQDVSKLPPEIQAQLGKIATDLGLPMDTVAQALRSPGAKYHVSKGDYTYFMDQNGNVLNKVYTPSGSTGSGAQDLSSYLKGNITSIPSATRTDVTSGLEAIQKDPIGGLLWTQRQNIAQGIRNDKQVDYPTLVAQKETAIKNTVEKIASNPVAIGSYLGIDPRMFTQDTLNGTVLNVSEEMKKQLEDIVRQDAEMVLPDTFLANMYGSQGKNPFGSLFASPADVTASDAQPSNQ